jgi:hypothetical protein
MEMKPGFAPVLDNWVPLIGSLGLRPGWRKWATGMPGRVGGLFAWRSGVSQSLFAASGTGIYDVTAAAAVGAPVVTGFSAAGAQAMMVAAGGGNFMLVWNGTNPEQEFNGTAWSAWSATGTPSPITWAAQYKTRMFCGKRSILSFWYGPPASHTGAFLEFPLQGVCTLGGGVAGGVSWTLDGGNGPDDYFTVVTTEGEVVVFKGTDPSSVTAWGLLGRYQVPRPLGDRFMQPFGGDVLLLTEGGIYALSVLATKGIDAAILPSEAYTKLIEPTFLDYVASVRDQPGWQIVPLAKRGLWLLNVPWGTNDAQQVAFHAQTGACGRWLGIPASCWLETAAGDYAGHAGEGSVLRFGEDQSDNGNAIAAELQQAFTDCGKPVALKAFKLAMPVMADAASAAVTVDMLLDWRLEASAGIARGPGAPPLVAPDAGSDALVWEVGLWDVGVWASGGQARHQWRAVRGIGHAGAVRARVLAQDAQPQWLGCNLVFQIGGPLR